MENILFWKKTQSFKIKFRNWRKLKFLLFFELRKWIMRVNSISFLEENGLS